jgi:hypothetical protein
VSPRSSSSARAPAAACIRTRFSGDERKRQRECRERLSASLVGGRHVLASAPKPAELVEKMLESWDEAVSESRASLQRRFAVILRESVASVETARRDDEVMSRASLGP